MKLYSTVDILVSNLPVKIKNTVLFLRIKDNIKIVQFICSKLTIYNELISSNYNACTSIICIVHSNQPVCNDSKQNDVFYTITNLYVMIVHRMW